MSSIDVNFTTRMDNLIGNTCTTGVADTIPIKNDPSFTRLRVQGWMFSWQKKSVRVTGRNADAFLHSKLFTENWKLLPAEQQIAKAKHLIISLGGLISELKSKKQTTKKAFFCFFRKAKLKEYEDTISALTKSQELLEELGKLSVQKLDRETPVPSRKLYKNGNTLNQFLEQFTKSPAARAFIAKYEFSTIPFIAMVRQLENQGLLGKCEACGLSPIFSRDDVPGKDFQKGTLDPKEIQKFNEVCFQYLERTYGVCLWEREEYNAYKTGEQVLTGGVFDKLIASFERASELKEAPVLVEEAPPPEGNLRAKSTEIIQTQHVKKKPWIPDLGILRALRMRN